MVADSVTVFRGSGAHAHRAHAVVVAGAARRWLRVMGGHTGAPLEVNFQPFLALKTPNFRPFGSRNASETAQKRLEERPRIGQSHGQRFS
jgi:hypothetical protein